MIKLSFALLIVLFLSSQEKNQLIFEADFNKPLDKREWIIESLAGSKVHTRQGKLIIDGKGGATVWLNKMLRGNIQIEYTRTVELRGGANDRLSDLNQFWMAKNPHANEFFSGRTGAFQEYDSLLLYYVGLGGNSNKTTRFRKYDGRGGKHIIQEYKDPNYLLKPNHAYRIKIIVKDSLTSFWVDDKQYFSYEDPDPIQEGYFGFRLLDSRQTIEDFRIYRFP